MSCLFNKKILIVMPFYFEYQRTIKRYLEERGADVYLINENVNEFSLKNRVVSVYFRSVYERMLHNYYKHRILSLPNNIDVILIIKGSTLGKNEMNCLEEKYPKARRIMYQWDSVKNYPYAITISKWCQENYSFDPDDAVKYGWKYRALFFDPSKYNAENDRKIDVAFICSLHSKRLLIFKQLLNFVSEYKITFFDYLYSNKWSFFRQKYLVRNPVFNIKSSYLKFKPLPFDKTSEIYNRTKILVDYKFENQVGLTMRTLESIGHKCKLATNNKQVVLEDFYIPGNIYVYDESNFEIPASFLKQEYIDIPDELYYKYSINGWIDDLFEQ